MKDEDYSEDSTVDDAQTANIIPFIMEKYNRAEDYRQQDECYLFNASFHH